MSSLGLSGALDFSGNSNALWWVLGVCWFTCRKIAVLCSILVNGHTRFLATLVGRGGGLFEDEPGLTLVMDFAFKAAYEAAEEFLWRHPRSANCAGWTCTISLNVEDLRSGPAPIVVRASCERSFGQAFLLWYFWRDGH